MQMHLSIIILILILLSGIHGSNVSEPISVNVLETLKIKDISCDLHDFLISNDTVDDEEHKAFINDLTTYCTDSESTKQYHLLCHMILIELEIGCSLPANSRPTPVKYTIPYTAKQICALNKIYVTNSWIWEKLSNNEKAQVGLSPLNLCSTITATDEMLRMAKFFYKIAPRIRRSDSVETTSLTTENSINLASNGTSVEQNKDISLIQQGNQSLINNTLPQSTILNQTVIETQKETISVAQPAPILNTTIINNNETINNSVIVKDVVTQPMIINSTIQEQVNLKTEKQINIATGNVTQKTEVGLPLGRAGEKPEREQANEREIPKALDVEAVFLPDNKKEQNWVEGKNAEKPVDAENLPSLSRIKSAEDSIVLSAIEKKKLPYRLKFNRQSGLGGMHSADSFITTFLLFILTVVIIYLIIHHKNKILGLMIEGCRRQKTAKNRRTSARHTRLSQS